MTLGAIISEFLFSLIDRRCKGIHRCGRYPISIDLSAEEGKKVPTF